MGSHQADLAAVYDQTRRRLAEFVASLPEPDLARQVPATPDWTIKDVIGHLVGNVVNLLRDDFPVAFFAAFGQPAQVAELNEWTARMVAERREAGLPELLAEWETSIPAVVGMLRGETALPDKVPPYVGSIMVTDLGAHQLDIYGALGLVRDRDSAPVRIGISGYVASSSVRLGGSPPLRLQAEDKTYLMGPGEPGATVTIASRFELFRALSGRRSANQVRGYDWDGDPEPYVALFYPYGPRADSLVEPTS
ncbi:MAG TPA: maleylpyruvate isomerase family mycothiol-dependent enzyme [Pseudonocardiaceae bacterium]|jgi:uncharacterized protein (TIGR03083 family)